MRQAMLWSGISCVLFAVLTSPADGQAANVSSGPGQAPPGSVSASAPAAAAPGPARAPGSPPPQPAGYPQVSVPLDKSNPTSSLDLPIAGQLAPSPINIPSQIHLAYAGSTPGSYGGQAMYFSWNTGSVQQQAGPVTYPNVSCTPSIVKYGLTPTALTQTASGSATAYQQLYTPQFGIEQNYSSASIHHVKVTGLLPNTRYYYQVGDGGTTNASPVLNFTSAPLPGTTGFRLVLFADLGQTYNSSSTVDHMTTSLTTDNTLTGAAPHLIYASDYSYADDYQSNGTATADLASTTRHQNFQSYQPREDSFGQFIAPLTQQYPFMGSQGNHEIQLQSDNVTNFVSWLHRYTFPWRESGSPSPFFYSYDYGGAHVISLSNYVWPNYKYDSPQYAWLQKDLASVNRTNTPWIIAQFHNPWYSTYSYSDFKQMDCLRQVLEPLMFKYGVDFVFNGHVHSYERFYSVNDWQINQCGYTSIVIGDGGNQEGLTINYVDKPGNCMALSNGAYYFQDICPTDAAGYGGAIFAGGNVSGFCPPANFQPSPSAYREPSFGHGTLDILNTTHAYWQWHRNQDGERVTADSIYVIRDTKACPSRAGITSGPTPQPAIKPQQMYYSASCGPACNNYTGQPATYGTNVDASGSIFTPASSTPCPVSG